MRELVIYYGLKEISFDEERLFAFGEQLVRQSSFVAETATTWGPGYDWPEIRSMLEALIQEGILKRGDAADDPRGGGLVRSPLPPSSCPVPRSWSAEHCEAISRELGGRPVEVGHLEAIISVYRIVHPALDGDGRQVGEANVFPPALRLDRDTEWRVCQYSGSRYRDDRPMNVTALKAMIKHWKAMMAVILEIRAEVKQRLARARERWTVADLHMFAGVALSVPAYQLLKRGGASPLPPLHPVLSSMFRITDGIRMTTHEMLFLSEERTRDPDEPVTAEELYGFAERNGTFLADAGVCAGPKAMIDEFFSVVFDGARVKGAEGVVLPPEIRDLLAELPAATDYALLGLQSWAVSRSIWLAMSRAYKTLRAVFEAAPEGDAVCRQLRARLTADWAKLHQGRIADDHEHDVHVTVYRDTYEQAWRALRSASGGPTLAERITPGPEAPMHAAAARALRDRLAARLAGSAAAGLIDRIVETLVRYLREEQAILASTQDLQREINAQLDRPQPGRPLTARDLHVTFRMYGGSIAEFPYLFDMLEEELGFHVACDAATIAVTDATPRGPSSAS
ncbi:MAG TPA: hypothetical protein VGD37_41965 [Kofleriaceae bacterium]